MLFLLYKKRQTSSYKIILIVEDEIKLSEVMTLYLRKENYDVVCVSDGKIAEDILTNEIFDLIILDMPFLPR